MQLWRRCQPRHSIFKKIFFSYLSKIKLEYAHADNFPSGLVLCKNVSFPILSKVFPNFPPDLEKKHITEEFRSQFSKQIRRKNVNIFFPVLYVMESYPFFQFSFWFSELNGIPFKIRRKIVQTAYAARRRKFSLAFAIIMRTLTKLHFQFFLCPSQVPP